MRNLLLEEIYNYYNNEQNYIDKSLNESVQCVVVDDNMFDGIMDMVQKNVFEEIENGHILIPIMGSYTFNITPDGECYLDDEMGNEYDAQIDNAKLQQILKSIESSKSEMMSEGKYNPFTKVVQDPETNVRIYTKKPDVSIEDAKKEAHEAGMRASNRSMEKWNDRINNPSLKDRREDDDYMDRVRKYWAYRREHKSEPHGFGTSGMMTLFPLDEMGYVNEDKLRSIINRVVKQTLK